MSDIVQKNSVAVSVNVNVPNAPDLQRVFTEALAVLEKIPASRQRSLAITKLQESLVHAAMADVRLDCPIRMR